MKFQIPNGAQPVHAPAGRAVGGLESKFLKNILLKNHTTFRIGGKAKYFFVVRTKEDIISGILWAKEKNLPFFILGGGSNVLISDEGYNGLIIKTKNKKLEIKNNKIFCESGALLSSVVNRAAKTGLTGLEWVVGIPGTVGGAIYGNAGAFGKSMKDIITKVEVYDTKSQEIKNLKSKDCKFNYRDSVFKKNKNLIILEAVIQLKKDNQKQIQKRIQNFLDYRRNTQPLGLPTAGSIFKNPPDLSAGELIEKAGLKGKKIGSAQISEKHANFIINLGRAKAKDVLKLINEIKQKVKDKFGIELEEEIQILGF